MTNDIFDISWVTPDTFDVEKLSVSKVKDRYKFMYQYNSKKPSEFRLTVPRNESAYVNISELSPEIYKDVPTGRKKCAVRLSIDNEHHYNLMAVINACCEKFADIHKIRSNALYINDEHSATLYCSIMENDNEVFTPFYTADAKLDTTTTGRFLGRPAFTFSVTEKFNLKCCIVQAYVHKQVPNFPLAYRD